MLKKVDVYSSGLGALELPMTPEGRIDPNFINLTNADGIGPVKANINTAPFGSIDGEFFTGTSLGSRNIVLTLLPNPDWQIWTISKIRDYIYKYFMPKKNIQMVFTTDEKPPVEILGYVESCDPAIFSKSGEIQVSIICPDPYFKALDETVLEGESGEPSTEIDYIGSVETGFILEVTAPADDVEDTIEIVFVGSGKPLFRVGYDVDSDKALVINSFPGQKFVRYYEIPYSIEESVFENMLSKVYANSKWASLTLEPGLNIFRIDHDSQVLNWKLTYFALFGGL